MSTQVFYVASSAAALLLWSIAYLAVAAVSHVAALAFGAGQFDWMPAGMSLVFLLIAFPKLQKPLMEVLKAFQKIWGKGQQ
ncbi:MAG: hypothetical protein JO189_00305 [Deltaproteobacteria bacterium]|nr:hypothetical protein [Deltaproteobacteria bacterium]